MLYSNAYDSKQNNTMILIGNGKVTATPDIALLRLGVQTTGENLMTAQSDNARLSQAVLLGLNNMGVTDIKTYQYTIDKLYDYVNGNRIDRGYSVRNIFEIRMTSMDQVGSVIDAAVNNGANVVDLIEFEVSNSDAYYIQALNLAVMNAYQKAKSIAMNLRLKMEPIPVKITENPRGPIPFQQLSAIGERAFTTPIEPGNKQIEASVTAEFIY
ncbi:MAG: hypothetical protein K0S76_2912 [Herbinix sp.]|jgi:uncharacterized protein YggE|nr:hypothetical protein [Herbinix sp.]